MKKIFLTFGVLGLTVLFVGCGGGSSSDIEEDTTTPVVVKDITLNAGDSKICTNETSFKVKPTSNPIVIFSTDASSGDTTILIDENSSGFVTISDCTFK